jgi:Zn-dependent peptidase ImmA (M78 family)
MYPQQPVDLEGLAAHLGAEIRVLDLEPDLAAILYRSPEQRIIVVNAKLDPQGKRFAIARQFGRLVLHKGADVEVDTGAPIDLKVPDKSDLNGLQALEATWFALELLTPENSLMSELVGGRLDLQDTAYIEALAGHYGVSSTLLMFRIFSLAG